MNYEPLMDTPEARAVLGTQWKPLPAAPVQPYFDLAWLPPVLRDMVQAVADNLSVPVDLPALCGLGVASACACGRVTVRLKTDWQEQAQLFLLCVMKSGEGKTPTFNHMTRKLYDYQAAENRRRIVQVEQDRASLETLQSQKAMAVKKGEEAQARAIAAEIANHASMHLMNRFIGGNVTPERLLEIMRDNNGATSVLDDEGELFDMLQGRYQDNPDLTAYLQGYSGGKPLTSERRNGSILVENPAVSVLVLTQPYVVNDILENKRMFGKGFLQRFLMACPEPIREYGEEPDMPAAIVREYEAAVDRMLHTPKTRLDLSHCARDVFFAFRDEMRCKQWSDCDVLSQYGITSKLIGNTARLAACLHLWESTDQTISAATMRSAVALARYFIGHLIVLMGTESTLTKAAKETLSLLVKKGEAEQNEREIKRALSGRKLFRADGAADAALAELEAGGYIERFKQTGTGRPVQLIRLHPDLLPTREVVDI